MIADLKSWSRSAFVVVIVTSCASTAVSGQELRGVVRDSAAHRPIPGAVIAVLDSTLRSLGRSITNEQGEYRLALPLNARGVRVVRLGYRPKVLTIIEGAAQLDITLLPIPVLLEPVSVTAASACPPRPDAAKALSLLEQARAGLLSTVVAREGSRSTLKLLAYQRSIGSHDDIEKQKVQIDSSSGQSLAFAAVNSGIAFVRDGFVRDSGGAQVYFGPDADVLLDDDFANGYCFFLRDAVAKRANQVGLAFFRPDTVGGRIDIDGTLWVDTVAHELRDIQFLYVGLPKVPRASESGGYVSFLQAGGGIVLVDRWGLRLVGATPDTVRGRLRMSYYMRHVGGELARASWPDGRTLSAPLGRLLLRLSDQKGGPAHDVTIRLEDTDYSAMPDSDGMVVIRDLLPGPYTVLAVDHQHESIDLHVSFVADRDGTFRAAAVVPSEKVFHMQACRVGGSQWVPVAAVRPNGSRVANVRWDIGVELGTPAERTLASGISDEDGESGFCNTATRGIPNLQLRATDPGDRSIAILDVPRDAEELLIHLLPRK